MYLELAENDPYEMMSQWGRFAGVGRVMETKAAQRAQGINLMKAAQAKAKEDPADAYLYVPAQFTGTGEGMYVREDSFDLLPSYQWEQLMDVLEPYQQQNMSLFGLGKKGRERRRLRREARWAAKERRIEIRGESGGGALGQIGDVIKNIFGGGEEPLPPEELPPLEPAKAGFMGMPNWVMPVVLVGGGIGILAMMGKRRSKK